MSAPDKRAFDTELFWYAGIFVRDHEVQRERFAHALAGLPDEWVLGPVVADIDSTLAAEQRTYRDDVDAVLAGDRYRALLDALGDLAGRFPTSSMRQPQPNSGHERCGCDADCSCSRCAMADVR